MIRYVFLIFALGLTGFRAVAQEVLTYEAYLQWVFSNHPIASIADITLEFGKQEMRIARGNFDPKLYADYDQKQFNSTNYYDKRKAGVSIPTWGGVEVRGLFEQNSGVYLNPERNVPQDGLLVAGVSVNLLQGLTMDPRRLAFRQAEVYMEATQAERRQILNDLFLDATDAYWQWSAAYQNTAALLEGVRLAEVRFEGIKGSVIYGDLPAIDTIEAYTQVLSRMYQLRNVEIELFNARQELSNFLWDNEQQPMMLNDNSIPQEVMSLPDIEFDKAELRSLIATHPELQLADFDLATLELERRWKAEQLRPVLALHYNFLSETISGFEDSPFLENNYRVGLTFRSPLFLRKERGGLGLTKAKIDYKQNIRDMKSLRLRNKLEADINSLELLEDQVELYSNNISGLRRLLEGELTRFEVGESSLFLINAREVQLFDALLILNNLAAKRNIAYVKVLNTAGLGYQDIEE